MSGQEKYLSDEDITISSSNGFLIHIILFDCKEISFECEKIQARSTSETWYLCTLMTGLKNIKNVDFPVNSDFLDTMAFSEKFNEVFDVDMIFRHGFFENIFGEDDERYV